MEPAYARLRELDCLHIYTNSFSRVFATSRLRMTTRPRNARRVLKRIVLNAFAVAQLQNTGTRASGHSTLVAGMEHCSVPPLPRHRPWLPSDETDPVGNNG